MFKIKASDLNKTCNLSHIQILYDKLILRKSINSNLS